MKWTTPAYNHVKTIFTWLPYSVPQKDGSKDWYWLEWITVKETPYYYGAVGIELIKVGK